MSEYLLIKEQREALETITLPGNNTALFTLLNAENSKSENRYIKSGIHIM